MVTEAHLVVVRPALQRGEHAEVDPVLEVVRGVLRLALAPPRALGPLHRHLKVGLMVECRCQASALLALIPLK